VRKKLLTQVLDLPYCEQAYPNSCTLYQVIITEKKSIELSIVVPVTNMAGSLGKLTDWLLRIEKYPWEVILVHDYRDAETSLELKMIVEKSNNLRIKFVENKFGSPGLARNIGIEISSGEWITFWDCDDSPQIAEVDQVLSNYIESSTEVLVANFIEFDLGRKMKIEHKLTMNFLNDLAKHPGLWRFIFRKNFLSNHRFKNLRMAEDQLFLVLLMQKNPKIILFPSFIYHYFTGQAGQLTKNKDALDDLSSAITEMLKIPNLKKNSQFNGLILLKLIISGLKLSRLKIKLKILIILIGILLRPNNSNHRIIWKAVINLVKT